MSICHICNICNMFIYIQRLYICIHGWVKTLKCTILGLSFMPLAIFRCAYTFFPKLVTVYYFDLFK